MFDKTADDAISPPSKSVISDITLGTLLEVGEGVLSWDTYRWYKGPVSCTPLIEQTISPPGASGESSDVITFVSVMDAKLAVEKIWLYQCGSDEGSDDNNDVGYCSGQHQNDDDLEGLQRSKFHSGFTYNAVGGALSLGTKADAEIALFPSYVQQMLAKTARGIGRRQYPKEDALQSGMASFRSSGAKVGRCTWNVNHDDATENQAELTNLPISFDKDIDCETSRKLRLRSYDDFLIKDSSDSKNGGKEKSGDDTQGGRRRLLGNGNGGAPNKLEDIPTWWFQNPFFDQNSEISSYGNVRAPYALTNVRNLVGKADEQTIIGTPPFGWDRQSCIMCWSGPIFIQNIIRRCKPQETSVKFASSEDSLDSWSHHHPPPLFICEAHWRQIKGSDERKQAFLHSKLWLKEVNSC
jgi:hypothetical protein